MRRGGAAAVPGARASRAAPRRAAGDAGAGAALLARLALTGLLGIGYEVLVVRVLSQVTEDTVYTFALLLAVYLVGSAAGAGRLPALAGTARGDPDRLSDRCSARSPRPASSARRRCGPPSG